MIHLYTLLFYLSLPFVLLRVFWRGRKAPEYRERWAERFGFFEPLPQAGCIWIHAVSLGETRAALPLVRALQERFRDIPILMTTTTPTGSRQVRESLGDSVHHVYLPYDIPDAVHRFLLRTRPRLAVIMETELWPNLYRACGQSSIPILIANARLSERSAGRYRSIVAASLIRQTLAHVTLIAAQTRSDASRFDRLGAEPERVQVTGNIKYDLTVPDSLLGQGREFRRAVLGQRPIWVAASTHAREDEIILQAFSQLRTVVDGLLLVLVPRHPERFTSVAELCERNGLNLVKRSDGKSCRQATDVFLGDSMGELLLFYAAADVAFVGGSLVPKGGHNILEPALLGLPVLFGPHMFNFTDASEHLLRRRAAWQTGNSDALAERCAELFDNTSLRLAMGRRGKTAIEANRGALGRLFDMLESLVEINRDVRPLRLKRRHRGQAGSEQPRS